MGAADGSIIATIMPAHMANTATAVSPGQTASRGIASRTSGCAMSSAIQAMKAQPAAKASPSAVQTWACRRNPRKTACIVERSRMCGAGRQTPRPVAG